MAMFATVLKLASITNAAAANLSFVETTTTILAP